MSDAVIDDYEFHAPEACNTFFLVTKYFLVRLLNDSIRRSVFKNE